MKGPTGSMGPFLEGYRQQEQQQVASQKAFRSELDAMEVVDLFVETGVHRMTILEIASRLRTSPDEARHVLKELVRRGITARDIINRKRIAVRPS